MPLPSASIYSPLLLALRDNPELLGALLTPGSTPRFAPPKPPVEHVPGINRHERRKAAALTRRSPL